MKSSDRGQMLNLDPDHDLIAINGRTVAERGVGSGNAQRIFFKPVQPTKERVIIEPHRDLG